MSQSPVKAVALEQAPPAVQLAVDLILLLEQHQLAPELVLAALSIVQRDFQQKLGQQAQLQSADKSIRAKNINDLGSY